MLSTITITNAELSQVQSCVTCGIEFQTDSKVMTRPAVSD